MVYCIGQRCSLEVECTEADGVTVYGDCLPRSCRMQRRGDGGWFALLILPPGDHRLRYMARLGPWITCVGHDWVTVTVEPRTAAGPAALMVIDGQMHQPHAPAPDPGSDPQGGSGQHRSGEPRPISPPPAAR